MPVELLVEHILSAIITGATIVLVAFSPIGRALGHRIMHGKTPLKPETDDARVETVGEEVVALRTQLEEMQERMDFAERMLAQARDRGALGPGPREQALPGASDVAR